MILVFFVGSLSGCKQEPQAQAVDAKTYVPEAPMPTLPSYAKSAAGTTHVAPKFSDVTAAAGLRFRHETGAFGEKWMPETIGGGGGFFDYDGDSRPDILLINSCYWPDKEPAGSERPMSRLYRSRGDGTYEDVTDASGLSSLVCYGMGACMADYDADGDNDIYITALGKNHLLRNDSGRFVDVTDDAGVGWSTCNGQASKWEWSTGATWLDYDRDGDLDLFVCNYVQWDPEHNIWNMIGDKKTYPLPQRYNGATCVLFRQDDGGKFTDVTKDAGVFNASGKSMSVVADDFDSDGWPDLVVTNDTQPNFLYLNQKNGKFVDAALMAGVAYDEAGVTRAGMGVDVAEMSNDGHRSIAIGNFSGEPVSLYTQESSQTFIDRSGRARLSRPTDLSLTFGVMFADFDLDGYGDLILANGHIEPEIETVRKDWQFAQLPQLFLNNSQGQFVEITREAGPPFQERIVGRGVSAADIDDDGDLDVLLTVNGGSPKLLRNDQAGGNASVRVRLVGTGRNLAAIGARIAATVGARTQTQFIRTGGSYLSQSELVATFGLGDAKEITELRIAWPDGSMQQVGAVPAGSMITVRQGREQVEMAALKKS